MDYVQPITTTKTLTIDDVNTSVTYYKPPISILGVVDETHPEYSATTTYGVGSFVKLDALKKIYRCTTANTLGKHPTTNPNLWIDYGPVNSWRMLSTDEFIFNKTTGENIVITMDFSRCDSFAFVSSEFSEVRIQVFNDTIGTIEFDKTYTGRDYGALSYADFYYKEFKVLSRLVVDGIPYIPRSRLVLTFKGTTSIGGIVIGSKRNMGMTMYGTSLKFDDTSKVSTSEITGARTVLRYGSVRVIDCKVIIDTGRFNECSNQIEELIGRNVLWVPSSADKFSELISIGYIEGMSLPITNGQKIETQTTIVGVI